MISYSLHLSNKKHALTTTKKVAGASKHNLRQYQSSDYSPEKIIVLRGENNILEDVKQIYHQEFEEALKEYNKGKRSDRQIDDYLQYVSESGKNDVAAEMIIQLGDKEFWIDKSMEQKVKMKEVFQNQIEALEELVPDFKIASAVLHLDEASPHMHIVGVPVATGYKRGLAKQTAKTKVFTMETLSMLQEEMHKKAEEEMEQNPELFAGEEIKTIERGRNSDWSKEYFVHKKEEQFQDLTKEVEILEQSKQEAEDEFVKTITDIAVQKEFMRYAFLEEPKSTIGKMVSAAWKQFKGWWEKQKMPEVEKEARVSIKDRLERAKEESKVMKSKKKIQTIQKNNNQEI